MEENKYRKATRLRYTDYSRRGIYFLTICTKDKKCLLSKIVGTDVPGGPQIQLLPFGEIAEKYIIQLNDFYQNISVDSYVIMPNHIHLILAINEQPRPSRTPVPTIQNSTISLFISTFKRFCNKECGENIWQYRSYDHIIRNLQDYERHIRYINENPMRWKFDNLYIEE